MIGTPDRPDLNSLTPPTEDDLAAETAKRMTELIAEMPPDGIVPSKEEFDRAAIRALDNL